MVLQGSEELFSLEPLPTRSAGSEVPSQSRPRSPTPSGGLGGDRGAEREEEDALSRDGDVSL